MNQEENILKTIIEKESWEDVIYYIVSLENLNPWDVDLVKLVDGFLKFINSVKELDFRIPAKIVFVAAILLRLKADYLSIFEEKESEIDEMLKESRPFEELGIDPKLVQLGYPMKRIPKRQVTLDELIGALKKALTVREKKEVRGTMLRERLEANVVFEEDITVRIEKVMKKIDDLIEKQKKDKIDFKQVVGKWSRDQIVDNFVPMLHLEQNQKIITEQNEFFKEIYISKRNENMKT
jgi:chromatin segregation and condensation protein Rec8/ScpA/Scc1 (kleisin family)